MSKIKRSYGIICCRKQNNAYQIILIKKPVTYYFCEFILGHYRRKDELHLKKLFNNMTYHEKCDILSLKFNLMWYRIYKSDPEKINIDSISKYYYKKKTKFETNFLYDNGKKLRQLISESKNGDTQWEVPKGRKLENKLNKLENIDFDKKYKEEDLNAAIREFTEETRISSNKYNILWHAIPYIETYSEFGITYQNIYYFASAIGEWEPSIKFSNNQQISEVASIKWCGKNDIKYMNLENIIYNRLKNMFDKLIKKYKKMI
jgi:8-oxo-dGTP pyrophosphatase MutT (NUDIX family)